PLDPEPAPVPGQGAGGVGRAQRREAPPVVRSGAGVGRGGSNQPVVAEHAEAADGHEGKRLTFDPHLATPRRAAGCVTGGEVSGELHVTHAHRLEMADRTCGRYRRVPGGSQAEVRAPRDELSVRGTQNQLRSRDLQHLREPAYMVEVRVAGELDADVLGRKAQLANVVEDQRNVLTQRRIDQDVSLVRGEEEGAQ